MKRGYYVFGFDEQYGVAVVASSTREAKSIAYKAGCFTDEDWIDINSKWMKDADVSNMPVGVVSSLGEGLKRGFYTFIDGICERCGFDEHLKIYNGSALCITCILELEGEKE